jgi:fructose-specific phosphotransferase system IIC component
MVAEIIAIIIGIVITAFIYLFLKNRQQESY